MYKKIFIGFLTVVLLNFNLGCYSYKIISVSELEEIEKEIPTEIVLKTQEGKIYNFPDSSYYVENDTLYGRENPDEEIILNISDIKTIWLAERDEVSTTLLAILSFTLVSLFVIVLIGLQNYN
jgi:hypothetical protein